MTIQEELQLVDLAKTNLQAFDTLYNYYFEKILFYCANRLSNIELAEDITGQVFLSAVENIRKFDTSKGVRFGSWLYTNAHNRIIDYYRVKDRKEWFDFDDTIPAKERDLEHELTTTMEQKKVSKALSLLHERYQEVISLRYYSELEIPEIALAMKIKPANVSVLIHRALDALRKEYKKLYPNSERF